MQKKTTRLRFTEEELENSQLRKAVKKADKAVEKADKAKEKIPARRKLVSDAEKASVRSEKLRFGKAEISVEQVAKPSRAKRLSTKGSSIAVSSQVHRQIAQNEDENVGVQSAHQSEELAETAIHTVEHAGYSKKIKAYNKAERLEKRADKANVDALYENQRASNPDSSTNPISRWRQKQEIKKEYAAARAGKNVASGGATTAEGAKKATKETKKVTERVAEFVSKHSHAILLVLIFGLLLMVVSSALSSCSVMLQGGSNVILGTSYTAEDEDIIGANNDYKALESALQSQINNIERTHSGYDEYKYHLDEINHNPYELTSYLTVLFEDYTREEVQGTLQELFNQQYQLTLREEIEIRTRTETRTGTRTVTDPETGETTEEEYEYEVEVEYDYYILHVTLKNNGLGTVIANSGLNEEQWERYVVLLQTQGNRSHLFADDIYANPTGPYTDYDIPGEALTDERFAKMIREAEKYLGYPYVWGGSSPSTSFDCSGFVSYVINHCGNGWSVGRLTASGLMNICDIIPPSQAKPGDLIFFQGTYDTSGASHVGIYVGNGMMIHCGNPISYASVETSYWQQHFYCYGRLP